MTQAWLFNFVYFRRSLSSEEKDYFSVGTTTNEQLHRELNNVFDNVHNIYKPIMNLKLHIFKMYKLIPHSRAMNASLTRQAIGLVSRSGDRVREAIQ